MVETRSKTHDEEEMDVVEEEESSEGAPHSKGKVQKGTSAAARGGTSSRSPTTPKTRGGRGGGRRGAKGTDGGGENGPSISFPGMYAALAGVHMAVALACIFTPKLVRVSGHRMDPSSPLLPP